MAPSSYKDKPSREVMAVSGRWVSYAHTVLAYTAFFSALVVGAKLHFHKIVQNEFYGYPDEWFPSVSATIGDRYPERAVFQFFIAVTSGPRFALVGLWYLLTAQPGRSLPKLVALMGFFRTLTCGGWTYITSTDDHDWHDILMILYIFATLPWTVGCIVLSPANARAVRYRKVLASLFFATLVPLIYFFIQHKVHRVAGAYTTYAFFEWSLIILDVAFDWVTALDYDNFEVVIRDVKETRKGVSASENGKAVENENAQPWRFGTALFSLHPAFDVAAEVYHGYVFWSMLTSLGVLIWYFPLWHMGISGYEAFVMSSISPLLLGIKPVRRWAADHLRLVHILSLSGVAAYLVEMPEARLLAVGIGVFMSCLGWVVSLSAEALHVHEGRLERKMLALMIGLVLSSTAKFAWWTNNPIWAVMNDANGGMNRAGVALAIVSSLVFTNPPSPLRGALAGKGGSPLLGALAVGGLFFGLHSLLSDTSTMILWTWEGYPARGPQAVPHGWFTLAAMSGGLIMGLFMPQVMTSWAAYIFGCVGAAVITVCGGWIGYGGALVIACYLMGISVPFISRAARSKSVATTFGLGFFIYNVMVLFHVWVVAYAFVPGGPLVREHTDWIMATMMVLLGAGVLDLKLQRRAPPRRRISEPSTNHRSLLVATLALVNALFLAARQMRTPISEPTPYHAPEKLITAGIWTIHFHLDNDMWSSERRMRDLLKDMEIDVMGLLESDSQRIIMGNRDATQFLAEDLGMYVDYGPGPDKHTWGAALLSKFPILNSTHHLLPSPVGELAPTIHATLDAYGEMVDVFVFHSGQEEDKQDRELQARYMEKLMGSTDRPAFLLSYLVTKPLKGNYKRHYVTEASGMHDVDPTDWDRWCEYILYKNIKRTGYARVSRSTITDTELQAAKFVVPTTDEEKKAVREMGDKERAKRKRERDVPQGMRWPNKFRGDGARGHFYHVFREPRYYD